MRVVELFAGVGGFRLGLEGLGTTFVWANQWEPGKKSQHAFDCYERHFGKRDYHVNEDISKVPVESIPDHDLLVGGFPCQDYSVATTNAEGIQGKKGVLWWEIYRIVKDKLPKYLLLENVDRLIKSPSNQRGRDFSIILSTLNSLGYYVEWRVINAADYGFPQRRRRTFIYATRLPFEGDVVDTLNSTGFFAPMFPQIRVAPSHVKQVGLNKDLVELSNSFSFDYGNSGLAINHQCYTIKGKPVMMNGGKNLEQVLEDNVDEKYYIKEEDLEDWKKLKGSAKIQRVAKNGHQYTYSQGAIPFPDPLDKPSRTIVTSESSKSRMSHVILDPTTNRYRILTPQECERLNGFPTNWTEGMPHGFRYFCMGNALVVGIIEQCAWRLRKIEYRDSFETLKKEYSKIHTI